MVLGISIRKCWCDYKILGGGYAGVWVRVPWEGDVKTIILYICWRKHLQRIKGRKEVSKRALRQCRSDDYERRRKEDWAGSLRLQCKSTLARLIVSLWFKVTHPEAVLRVCVSHLGMCSQWLALVPQSMAPVQTQWWTLMHGRWGNRSTMFLATGLNAHFHSCTTGNNNANWHYVSNLKNVCRENLPLFQSCPLSIRTTDLHVYKLHVMQYQTVHILRPTGLLL